jgi:hypothetical protein
MMPAGHKAIHDVHVHIRQSDHKPLYNVQTTSGARFVVIFSKRPVGHGKGLRGPRVKTPDLHHLLCHNNAVNTFHLCAPHISYFFFGLFISFSMTHSAVNSWLNYSSLLKGIFFSRYILVDTVHTKVKRSTLLSDTCFCLIQVTLWTGITTLTL